MTTQGVIVRAAKPSDMSYVLNSWCRSTYTHLQAQQYISKHGPPPHYGIYKTLFDDVQKRIVANSDVSIASNEDDDDQILGFLIHGESDGLPLLHYIQVKHELWRNGVAATMCEKANIDKKRPCIYTFTSPILGKWKAPHKWRHIPHWMLEK